MLVNARSICFIALMLVYLCPFNSNAQVDQAPEEVSIQSSSAKTRVYTENGRLHLNVNPKDLTKFKAAGVVTYVDFGAKGDGKTDDIDAIAATHALANKYRLKV